MTPQERLAVRILQRVPGLFILSRQEETTTKSHSGKGRRGEGHIISSQLLLLSDILALALPLPLTAYFTLSPHSESSVQKREHQTYSASPGPTLLPNAQVWALLPPQKFQMRPQTAPPAGVAQGVALEPFRRPLPGDSRACG